MTEVIPRAFVRRPEPPPWLVKAGLDKCGHCKSGHCRSCKGAVRVPPNKQLPSGVMRCYCDRCVPQVRCLDCNNQFEDDVNPRTWSCRDQYGCRSRIEMRLKNDRLWQLIQACKSSGANERKQKRLDAERIKAQVGGEPEDRVAVRTPRPTRGECECCGVPTKGGKFAPGHDARMKSRLKAASNQGDKEAYRQLVERGWINA